MPLEAQSREYLGINFSVAIKHFATRIIGAVGGLFEALLAKIFKSMLNALIREQQSPTCPVLWYRCSITWTLLPCLWYQPSLYFEKIRCIAPIFLAAKAVQCDIELVHAGTFPKMGESASGKKKMTSCLMMRKEEFLTRQLNMLDNQSNACHSQFLVGEARAIKYSEKSVDWLIELSFFSFFWGHVVCCLMGFPAPPVSRLWFQFISSCHSSPPVHLLTGLFLRYHKRLCYDDLVIVVIPGLHSGKFLPTPSSDHTSGRLGDAWRSKSLISEKILELNWE